MNSNFFKKKHKKNNKKKIENKKTKKLYALIGLLHEYGDRYDAILSSGISKSKVRLG